MQCPLSLLCSVRQVALLFEISGASGRKPDVGIALVVDGGVVERTQHFTLVGPGHKPDRVAAAQLALSLHSPLFLSQPALNTPAGAGQQRMFEAPGHNPAMVD